METNKVLIVGGYTFGQGEAGSNYVIGLGQVLQEAGYAPEYLADDGNRDCMRPEYKNFPCHSAPPDRAVRGWRSAMANLTASQNGLLNWLSRTPAGEYHLIVAHLGGLPVAFLIRLIGLCRQKGWKLAMIVGEWQGLKEFGLLRFRDRMLAILDSEVQRRIVNKRVHNIIAISRYLERYYQLAGCHTVLIPPVVDTRAEKWNCRRSQPSTDGKLRLLFSGGWWRDRLDLIVEAVARTRREGHNVGLEFLGSKPEEIQRRPALWDQIVRAPKGTFRFHGLVPVEEVLPITASADFGVLLRDHAKWAEACFPSKVTEFQTLGVPMMCNLTSNLDEVLEDGKNALIVPQPTTDAFVATVKRALSLSKVQTQQMKQRSLERAANWYDYRVYSEVLGAFIRGISVGKASSPVIGAGVPRHA